MSLENKKIAIIASSLHPIRQKHLLEWYVDMEKEILDMQLFLGSETKAIPYAKPFKFSSKKSKLAYLVSNPLSIFKILKSGNKIQPIKDFKPHIIHLLTSNAFPYFENYFTKEKKKLIISFRGFDIDIFPNLSSENLEQTQKIFDSADILHFISENLRESAIKLGADPMKCVVIKRSKRSLFQNQERISRDKIVIITVARLVWEKGFVYALEAIKELINRGYNPEYRIIGDGVDFKLLKYHQNRLNLTTNVLFLGEMNHNEIVKELSKADIYFQPSLLEALSVSLIEASSVGLPIVASNVGGIPEVVLNNESGFLTEPCNIKDQADKLEILINDEELRHSFGKSGINHIESDFNKKKIREKWIEIYSDLLK